MCRKKKKTYCAANNNTGQCFWQGNGRVLEQRLPLRDEQGNADEIDNQWIVFGEKLIVEKEQFRQSLMETRGGRRRRRTRYQNFSTNSHAARANQHQKAVRSVSKIMSECKGKGGGGGGRANSRTKGFFEKKDSKDNKRRFEQTNRLAKSVINQGDAYNSGDISY
jgi:hypothetical protein